MDIFYELMIPIPKIEIQTKCVEQLNDLSNQKEMINSMKDGIKRQMKYFIDSQIQKSVNDNNVDFKTIKEICVINNGERVTKKKNITIIMNSMFMVGVKKQKHLK